MIRFFISVGYVNGNLEPVCRDEVICEPIDLNKGIGKMLHWSNSIHF